jgi:pimeloyl-ACP methyl ester carboxylesterase
LSTSIFRFTQQGILTRYVEEGRTQDSPQKPALLCIHGFGASVQHWGRNIASLSEDSHVFAFCNIGFGRAEKPPMKMTQHVWEAVSAEFVRDVIGRSVFVAGNSIGGGLGLAYASDSYPELCSGVCLVNTAGNLSSPDELLLAASVAPKKPSFVASWLKQNRKVAEVFGIVLLSYLQGNIEKTLSRVYPSQDRSWNAQLAKEIRRNSYDWGAAGVSKLILILSLLIMVYHLPTNKLTMYNIVLLDLYFSPQLHQVSHFHLKDLSTNSWERLVVSLCLSFRAA